MLVIPASLWTEHVPIFVHKMRGGPTPVAKKQSLEEKRAEEKLHKIQVWTVLRWDVHSPYS
jgi:hypothetical protein